MIAHMILLEKWSGCGQNGSSFSIPKKGRFTRLNSKISYKILSLNWSWDKSLLQGKEQDAIFMNRLAMPS